MCFSSARVLVDDHADRLARDAARARARRALALARARSDPSALRALPGAVDGGFPGGGPVWFRRDETTDRGHAGRHGHRGAEAHPGRGAALAVASERASAAAGPPARDRGGAPAAPRQAGCRAGQCAASERQRHARPSSRSLRARNVPPSASPRPSPVSELDPKLYRRLAIGHTTLAAAEASLIRCWVAKPRSTELDVRKRHANCPCFIGPAGVGKTSVVRGPLSASPTGAMVPPTTAS